MSSRNRVSVSTLAIAAAFVLLATMLAIWPAEPAHAQDTTPNVAVITSTVKLASTTSSINVPIVLTTGISEVGSAAFTLDYDESCIRIDNTSTDITGLPSTHLNSLVNNPVSGTLQISVWDVVSPTTELVTGNIAVIKFGLDPDCRPPADNTDIVFSFSDVSFGNTASAIIEPSAAYTGTYTLEPNHTPTSLAFTPTDMAENKSGSRTIGGLSANNHGDSDTLTYSLATTCSGTWSNEGFSVSGSDLYTVLPFDYDDGAQSYNVCVQVDDGRGGIVAATKVLIVEAANDTPTEVELSSSTIYTGTPVLDAIGTFTTTDADAGDTFTYTLVSGDGDTNNALFDISGYTLTVSGTLTYPAQYKIRVQTEDGGGATYARQFTLQALANAALALPGEPAVPFVVGTNAIAIPIKYTANANSVITATFDVAYVNSCLTFTSLNGLQTGFAKTGSVEDDDGSVQVSIVVDTAGAVLHDGALGYLNFTGKSCALADSWTALTFSNVSLKTHNDVTVDYETPVNGKLIVVPDKNPGDCNSDGSVNAADFSATAREIWDVESVTSGSQFLNPNSWLWSPLGDYDGSAKGCDSNEDRTISPTSCARHAVSSAPLLAAPAWRRPQAHLLWWRRRPPYWRAPMQASMSRSLWRQPAAT